MSLMKLKLDIVGEDNKINIFNEIETLTSEDKTIEEVKNDFQDEI